MTLCNTLARRGGRSKRTPLRVSAVPHLLGHHTVDILGDTAGHQIDGHGANKVPAKSCIVLQTIARAILRVGREQGGNKVLVCGWSPAHPPPLNNTDTLGSEGYCHFSPPLLGQVCSRSSSSGQGHTSFHFPSSQFSCLGLITNYCCL